MECVFLPFDVNDPFRATVLCHAISKSGRLESIQSWQLLFDDYVPDTKAVTLLVPQRTRDQQRIISMFDDDVLGRF